MLFNKNKMTFGPVALQQPVISGSGATASLNETDSGSVVLCDRAAGIVFTLPTTPTVGTFFDFHVTTSVTSNAYKIITGSATELLIGGYTHLDSDTSNAMTAYTGNGSTHIAVNMTAASSNALGGLAGTKLRFTCLSATRWMVEGLNIGGGSPATAFATS